MVWHIQVVPDDYNHPKHCTAAGELKPRRPLPQIRASEFFPLLQAVGEGANRRWVFPAYAPGLNGWPALTCLELRWPML